MFIRCPSITTNTTARLTLSVRSTRSLSICSKSITFPSTVRVINCSKSVTFPPTRVPSRSFAYSSHHPVPRHSYSMAQLKAKFKVRLIFVRHGESEMNTAAHLLGGQHNHVPLTALGIAQATLLGQRLQYDRLRFDQIYTSTAVRAMMTAEIALRTAGLSQVPIAHTDALLEQAQGDWEGKHRSEVYTEEVHQAMLDLHLDFQAPGGESLRGVQKRALAFLNKEVDKWKELSEKEKGREIVLGIFGHGGCIRTLLHHYCGFHDQWTWLVMQDNTAMNELLLDSRGTATVRINDTAHLKYSMAPPALGPATTNITKETESPKLPPEEPKSETTTSATPSTTQESKL